MRHAGGAWLRVVGHAGAEAALAELRRGAFDVLLTDLVMLGMTGIELLREGDARAMTKTTDLAP